MKKYRIELTEEQMRVLEKCTEEYMRLRLGQVWNFANDLSGVDDPLDFTTESGRREFERRIEKRNNIEEVMHAVFRIAFGSFGAPDKKSEDCMIAECMCDAIRFARGTNTWPCVMQIGKEPIPKIERIE